MTTRETQHELYQVLEAHKFDLEITRGVTTLGHEILDRRIEAARLLLEWLSQALEPHPAAFPAAQTLPPSSAVGLHEAENRVGRVCSGDRRDGRQ
jgi:hypothetical protein